MLNHNLTGLTTLSSDVIVVQKFVKSKAVKEVTSLVFLLKPENLLVPFANCSLESWFYNFPLLVLSKSKS